MQGELWCQDGTVSEKMLLSLWSIQFRGSFCRIGQKTKRKGGDFYAKLCSTLENSSTFYFIGIRSLGRHGTNICIALTCPWLKCQTKNYLN